MDLNYLFHRHQESLMRADAAQSDEAEREHRGEARDYAVKIERVRADLGAGKLLTMVD